MVRKKEVRKEGAINDNSSLMYGCLKFKFPKKCIKNKFKMINITNNLKIKSFFKFKKIINKKIGNKR